MIRELPFGATTESLIASIESAAKQNKIKISSINDFNTDHVEIEIHLARGIHTRDTVDALYAFTDCEMSISVNLLVIRENQPVVISICEMIRYYADRLTVILRAELKLEEKELNDKLHARTLEQIFIEERIYKRIEKMKTHDSVVKAVISGFEPFADKLMREISGDDVERLLKIPIRRISLYDINKVKKEMDEINTRLMEIKKHLANLVDYAVSFLDSLLNKYRKQFPRRTQIVSFDKVDVREAAQRNLKLKYDRSTGYIGYEVSGNVLFDVSNYDRVLVIRKTGSYSVMDVPDKCFVDKGMLYCDFADPETMKNTLFTVVYKNDSNGSTYIKRCKIDKFILNKEYSVVPDNCSPLLLTLEKEGTVSVEYKPRPRLKVLQEEFRIQDYLVKGVKAAGVRLANKEAKSARMLRKNGEEQTEMNLENDPQ